MIATCIKKSRKDLRLGPVRAAGAVISDTAFQFGHFGQTCSFWCGV